MNTDIEDITASVTASSIALFAVAIKIHLYRIERAIIKCVI